ncbi:MAG: flagellar basal body P-ring formation protein FlgA [Bryobacterales bacterium]|nr:flagellar basal body P-ring formation protein FlgA [Bryobacterales bacterium]
MTRSLHPRVRRRRLPAWRARVPESAGRWTIGLRVARLAGLVAMALNAACVPVEGERIEGRHLAAAAAEFAGIAPDAPVAYAPAPGVKRRFSPAGLRALAARHGLRVADGTELPEACFERRAKPLTREAVEAAVRASLPPAGVTWELLDFSRAPAPDGELIFPAAGLSRPPAGAPRSPVFWRGRLKYGGHSLPVWARLRVWRTGRRVVAAEALPAGRPVEAGQLRLETIEGPPFGEPAVSRIEEAAGRVPRRTLRKGEPVTPRLLAAAPDVRRGETVQVEVMEGSARLRFEARAESGGRTGETITVRNPGSGRRFRARIEGRGAVVVGQANEKNRYNRSAVGAGPGWPGGE